MHTGRKSKSARKFNLEKMFETTRRTAHNYSAQIIGSCTSGLFFLLFLSNPAAAREGTVGEASGDISSTDDDGGRKGPLSMVCI